ncbi:MAG: type II toxin-antitoxin system RelE/ParE family toxin [Caldilineaceae bacterium]
MPKVVQPKQAVVYADAEGYEPFTDWLMALRDTQGRQRILVRIGRLEQGNYGDVAPVDEGVSELRLFFGPGYRIYFAEEGNTVIILLCGGDKSTQHRDIAQAKVYWKEFQSRAKF